ncbi:MAG: GIY-YIG nuclease family protein [Bacteroidetes bacterium]|nr:GIY-YIG nuclease family protein [Bacteroidota bacterium]
MKEHNYCVYILTNKNKKVLYTGVTNSLDQRLTEHYFAKSSTFVGKYNCHYLLYYVLASKKYFAPLSMTSE